MLCIRNLCGLAMGKRLTKIRETRRLVKTQNDRVIHTIAFACNVTLAKAKHIWTTFCTIGQYLLQRNGIFVWDDIVEIKAKLKYGKPAYTKVVFGKKKLIQATQLRVGFTAKSLMVEDAGAHEFEASCHHHAHADHIGVAEMFLNMLRD